MESIKYTETTIREPGGPVLPALYDTRLTGVIRGIWFYITASFIVYPNGTSAVSVWLYNATGGGFLVARFTVTDPAPITGVNTFGVGVYQIRMRLSAIFQMVGLTSYTFFVIISGLTYCCYVYVYDSSGVLIGQEHVNETGIVGVELSNPMVVNSSLKIVCNNFIYEVPVGVLMGGGILEIYFYFSGPILMVFSNSSIPFTGWSGLVSVNCDNRFYYIEIGLVNQTHVSTINLKIIQQDNYIVILQPETELMIFTPQPTLWAGNLTMKTELYFNTTCYLSLRFYYNFAAGVVGILNFNVKITTR